MNLRIILADDHPVVLAGARAVIEHSGIGAVVGEARNSNELLALLKSTACDVLVTDFSMPGPAGDEVDGLGMIGRIRRRFPGLPIILLTMVSNPGILRSVIAAGVQGVIDKNSSMDELPMALQAAAGGAQTYLSRTLHQRLQMLPKDMETQVQLSPRESEVIRLLARGLTVTEISVRLHRTVATISRQKNDAMRKLGISSDVELYAYAREHGLTN